MLPAGGTPTAWLLVSFRIVLLFVVVIAVLLILISFARIISNIPYLSVSVHQTHITGINGLIISLFSSLGRDSALITTVAGAVMAVLYTLCAGLLTFDNGPATYVGNHYFSAWAGFFISFAVFGSVLKEFLGVGGGAAASSAAAAETDGDDQEMDRI
mmetsp:Transcript_9106/g.20574  ORF Transcript_9106/g.20574 Transcript_9106/m.20574 type:complete len:157 (-) Transcript_9106:272-742(-)